MRDGTHDVTYIEEGTHQRAPLYDTHPGLVVWRRESQTHNNMFLVRQGDNM